MCCQLPSWEMPARPLWPGVWAVALVHSDKKGEVWYFGGDQDIIVLHACEEKLYVAFRWSIWLVAPINRVMHSQVPRPNLWCGWGERGAGNKFTNIVENQRYTSDCSRNVRLKTGGGVKLLLAGQPMKANEWLQPQKQVHVCSFPKSTNFWWFSLNIVELCASKLLFPAPGGFFLPTHTEVWVGEPD